MKLNTELFLASIVLYTLLIINVSAEEKTITVNGTIREYIIEVPSNYDGSVPYDLILVYHGMGGTAQQTTFTGFHNSGNNDKFITIYPQGLDDIENIFDPGTFTTGWKFEVQNNRDVTFTEVLLDTLYAEYNLKEKGVYVTGISNGGYFSDILACNIGDRLAAIAPVIGGYPFEVQTIPCPVTKNLPVFHLGSEHDAIVDIEHLRSATKYWLQHNNCDDTPVIEGICEIYTGNEDDAVVYHCEFVCLVDGAPVTEKNDACHTWPTAFTGYDFETTDMILDFFREYGLGDVTYTIHSPTIATSGNYTNTIPYETHITFVLAGTNQVSLNIYNLRGIRVATVINNQQMIQGKHTISFSNTLLSNGAYILKLQVGNKNFHKKLYITK